MERRIGLPACCAALLFLVAAAARAEVFPYRPTEEVIGHVSVHRTGTNESLIEIARELRLGYNAVTAANPGLDPFIPGAGVAVVIPAEWVLPERPPSAAIVVNLSEMRLYCFFSAMGRRQVATFPVGVGDEGRATPLGNFSIVEKITRPSWRPPPSIRAEDPGLPAVVPPGPENPLGSRALRLSARSVLIHGTNRPFGIGRKVSHGCIHLYEEDMAALFSMVPRGARVSVVRQPVKVGLKGGRVYIEVHHDADFTGDYRRAATALIGKRGLEGRVSERRTAAALARADGVPADITGRVP